MRFKYPDLFVRKKRVLPEKNKKLKNSVEPTKIEVRCFDVRNILIPIRAEDSRVKRMADLVPARSNWTTASINPETKSAQCFRVFALNNW